MNVCSLLRRAGVFALAMAGCAAPAFAPDAANAAVRSGGSPRIQGFAGYSDGLVGLGGYGGASSVSVTTTFVVPTLRCGSADEAIAPSVGASLSPSANAGRVVRPWAAAMFVGCHSGKAHYWPELEANGSTKNYPSKVAHAGDRIVLWLDTKSGHLSVADETHKFKVSRTARHGFTPNSAWVGDEGWASSHGRLERVPDFGKLTYSNTKLDKRPFWPGYSQRSANRTSGGTLQIKTGPMFPGGKAFRTYFKHS